MPRVPTLDPTHTEIELQTVPVATMPFAPGGLAACFLHRAKVIVAPAGAALICALTCAMTCASPRVCLICGLARILVTGRDA